jgi:hypothetical protein
MTPAMAWKEVVETSRQLDMAMVYDIDIDACFADRRWALAEWQIACAVEHRRELSRS